MCLRTAELGYKVDPETGNAQPVTTQLPTAGRTPSVLQWVGGSLYASIWSPTGSAYTGFIRISTTDGTATTVAARPFVNVTGVTSDGAKLLVADASGANSQVLAMS